MTTDPEYPVLASQGLYAADIVGDGNCLFRALSDQLYGDESRHKGLRKAIVKYMEVHSEYFRPFVEGVHRRRDGWVAYLRRMARERTYGDNLEIVACSRLYKVDVAIYQPTFCYVIEGRSYADVDDAESDKELSSSEEILQSASLESTSTQRVHIAYHTWEHYSSVRNLDGPHTGLPKVRVTAHSASARPAWEVTVLQKSLPRPLSDMKAREALERYQTVEAAIEKLLEQESEQEMAAHFGIAGPGESGRGHGRDNEDDDDDEDDYNDSFQNQNHFNDNDEDYDSASRRPTPDSDDTPPSSRTRNKRREKQQKRLELRRRRAAARSQRKAEQMMDSAATTPGSSGMDTPPIKEVFI
ncbi:hypothetical protein CANCADRAFT_32064 [Tortispora caseinolytica NRRL Y-17796]|uniref:OTU domain-containing protein n=1 Tax=Tortispora caseinolytica NRRL Y-17796 TaxID=767744 RepID=A0A1E4TI18_9ASCO|nr:hypothetical protein CANCADRAFT_32064 [Tortispora caseinolytica NRRL Y-17796]